MSKVKITRIDQGALDRVQTLALDIWPKAYRNIIGPDKVDAMLAELYAIETLESEMRDGHVFWIAQFNDHDVAYASAYQDGDCLWLKKLYCRQEFRGLGIGSRLMQAACGHFPMAKTLRLFVNKDNTPAIAYYLKNGFVNEAEVPVKMGPFEFSDYQMCKALV